jgi:uncharacterized membrane protein
MVMNHDYRLYTQIFLQVFVPTLAIIVCYAFFDEDEDDASYHFRVIPMTVALWMIMGLEVRLAREFGTPLQYALAVVMAVISVVACALNFKRAREVAKMVPGKSSQLIFYIISWIAKRLENNRKYNDAVNRIRAKQGQKKLEDEAKQATKKVEIQPQTPKKTNIEDLF